MTAFACLLLCIQACLIQNAFSAVFTGLNSPYGALGVEPYSNGGPVSRSCGAAFAVQPFGLGGFGALYTNYGGAGIGNLAVAGELPVGGATSLAGQVPIIGGVEFAGLVPAAGAVTISGTCGVLPGSYFY